LPKVAPMLAGLLMLLAPTSALANSSTNPNVVGSLTTSVTANSLSLEVQTTTVNGAVPPYATNAVIRLGTGVKLDMTDPARCVVVTNCPSDGSVTVGSGSAMGEVQAEPLPNPPLQAPVGVIAYAGPLTSGLPSLVLQLTGSATNALVGTLSPDTGVYGTKLTLPVPPIPLPGTSDNVSLTQFSTTVGGSQPDASGKINKSSKKTFTLRRKATKTFQLAFPLALKYPGAKYTGSVKISGAGVKVLKKGSALGGSVYRVKVRNTGKKTAKVTITTKTVAMWQFVAIGSCSPPGVPFEAITTYADGTVTDATSTAACP